MALTRGWRCELNAIARIRRRALCCIVAAATVLSGCALCRQPSGVQSTFTTTDASSQLKDAYFEALESETNAETILTLDISIPSVLHETYDIPLRRAFSCDIDGSLRLPEREWNMSSCADGISPTGKGLGYTLFLYMVSEPDDPGIKIHVDGSWTDVDGRTRSIKEVMPIIVGSEGRWILANGLIVTTAFRKPKVLQAK